MRLTSKSTSTKSGLSKRLVLGFAALASAAVVGGAGLVGAATDKPSKAQCSTAGYKNYGQCVKDWATKKHGYGGGTGHNINTNIEANVEGDDNVINIVINYFLG